MHSNLTLNLFLVVGSGQTGAGKTFTMGTAASSPDGSLDDTAGIIPRAVDDLFNSIKDKCSTATVSLSYLELYNEKIRDLFAVNPDAKASLDLKIRETPGGNVEVAGCVEKSVNSPAEIGAAMEEAAKRRVVAATAMNATSSRSHAICSLRIRGTLKDDENSNEQASTTKRFSSKLTLVDLAGSERIKKTGAQGARQTEGININKSLLVLGQVVSALSQGSGPGKRKPPYRDSKLTRLLQDSLGGNSRTIMVACVSPAHGNLDESTNTLRYASSARRITNRARQNVALSSTLSPQQVAALKKENATLQEQMAQLQSAMAKMEEELKQVRKDAAPDEKRESPSRTVSRALTASTSGVSDDEMASRGRAETKGPTEVDKVNDGAENLGKSDDAIPAQINVDESKASSHVSSDLTKPFERKEPDDESSPCDDDENSADGYGTELDDESEHFSDWLEDDEDYEVHSLPEKATDLLRRREAAYFLEISNQKLIVADLEAKLDVYLQENTDLQNELAETREDAESARKAANLLSDIVDELRDIKRGELEKKQQQLQMTLKEQNWISFVQVMLQNYRMQVAQLSTAFNKTVVRTIDNLEFTEKKAESEHETRTKESGSVNVALEKNADNSAAKPADEATPVDTSEEEVASIPPPAAGASNKRRVARRRSWWGGIVEEAVPEPPKILPWKEAVEKFDAEIRRVEEMLISETESMQSIQANLADEVTNLEREVGAKKLETNSMFASVKDANHEELLENLSSLLLRGPVLGKV